MTEYPASNPVIMDAMTGTEESGFDVVVTFSAAEREAIAEHAAELQVPLNAYIHKAATRRARDGDLKRRLRRELANNSRPEEAASGRLSDILEPFVDLPALTDEEKEARAREAARECGIEYTPQVRALGQALWARTYDCHGASDD